MKKEEKNLPGQNPGAELLEQSEKNEIEKLSKVAYAIQGELAEIMHKMGASQGLLSVLMSWGDTLPSETVLEMLKEHNFNMQLPDQLRQHTFEV